MLVKRPLLDRIKSGDISLVFRRWKRPTVRSGGTLRTQIGVITIEGVTEVAESDISERDAARAGYESRADLVTELNTRSTGAVYRIAVGYGGEDPRIALRSEARLSASDVAMLEARLARYDQASRRGPWTAETLRLIEARPATLAADLAAAAGWDRAWFKTNVRKLKELGLTESLKKGYRLSPRGQTFLGCRDKR